MFQTPRPTMWQTPRLLSGYLPLVVGECLTRASRYNPREGITAVKRCDVLENSG